MTAESWRVLFKKDEIQVSKRIIFSRELSMTNAHIFSQLNQKGLLHKIVALLQSSPKPNL